MKINNDILRKTRRYSRKVYCKADFVHNWENHIELVVRNARYIARKEKMDINIAEMGALLHDIARMDISLNAKNHASPSEKKARRFLESLGIDKDVIEKISEAVRCHSGKGIKKARWKETLAVFDADKLDHVGPRGIMRCVCCQREENPGLNLDSLLKHSADIGKDRLARMKTRTGRALAKKYVESTRQFIIGYKKMSKIK